MVWKKQNPEDGKEIPKITKVILNDLNGKREIYHDFRKKNNFQKKKKTTEKEDVTDNTQWMPKHIPKEVKQLIKKTAKPKRKQPARKKRILVRKEKDSFEYVVQLKNGKIIKSKRVIIKGEKVILMNKEVKIEISASSVRWIKENRTRVMTLHGGKH